MPTPPPSRHPPAGDPPARRIDTTSTSPPARTRARSDRSAAPTARALTGAESAPDLLRSLSHLTARDLTIASWLDQHVVLTTGQISTAVFANITTASHRLAKLRTLGLIDRFHRPMPRGGYSPWHWVIGPLGAQITAAARNTTPPTRRQLQQRHARLADSNQLGHRLGTNQFFIDLYAHTRRHPDTQLVRWWSEHYTARRYSHRIQPDGHALWRTAGITMGLFLEYDTGSEDLGRLVRKVDGYDQLAADGGPAYPVLFWLHSRGREQHLHDALAHRRHALVPVATGVRGIHHPAAAVWSLNGHTRHRLTDLPSDHGNPDSMYNPNLHDPDLDQFL